MAAGDVVIAPGLTRELIDVLSDRLPGHAPGQKQRLAFLTQRERESLTQRERASSPSASAKC